jgi:hypothetical protein
VGTARPLWELLDPEVVVGFAPFTPDEVTAMQGCGVTKIVPGVEPNPSTPDPLGLDDGPRLQVEHLRAHGHERTADRCQDLVTSVHRASTTF